MDDEFQRSLSLRSSRRADRSNSHQTKDVEGGFFVGGLLQDYPMKIIWEKGFIRLVIVAGIIWMFLILTALLSHLPHRCSIPLADDPEKVVIPKTRTPNNVVQSLSYIMEDELASNGSQSPPLFGGHQSWLQSDESFKPKLTMKIHCGFIQNGGAEIAPKDIEYANKCKFVVASGIFDGYDTPHQPSNISTRSQKLFCFLMAVDEISLQFIKKNVILRKDNDGGLRVGIWRLVLLKHPPYDEPTGYILKHSTAFGLMVKWN